MLAYMFVYLLAFLLRVICVSVSVFNVWSNFHLTRNFVHIDRKLLNILVFHT